MPQRSKLCQEAHSKKARLIHKQRVAFVKNELAETLNLRQQLINEENLRVLVNERSKKVSKEAEKSTVSKEKLEEYTRKLQGTVEELGRRNYDLGREGRVLRGLVGDYESQNRFLEGFVLMVFILGQLVVGLYLLGLFDGNNVYVTIFQIFSKIFGFYVGDMVSKFCRSISVTIHDQL